MSEALGPEKLYNFLEKHGISFSKAAEALGVSHVTVSNWCRKASTPTHDYRHSIAVWTNNEVIEVDWLSEKERRRAARLALVRPFQLPVDETSVRDSSDDGSGLQVNVALRKGAA